MADNMRTDLVCDAIDMAVRRCPHQKNVTIFHSDRGSQYTSQQFARHLEHHKIRPSVGRTGVCWDNAWAESFNATLKNERVHRMVRPTREKAINFCCLVDRTDLQSHATPLNARLPHPQRGRTRAEKPQTRSLRPPKTTVRETPSTPSRSAPPMGLPPGRVDEDGLPHGARWADADDEGLEAGSPDDAPR